MEEIGQDSQVGGVDLVHDPLAFNQAVEETGVPFEAVDGLDGDIDVPLGRILGDFPGGLDEVGPQQVDRRLGHRVLGLPRRGHDLEDGRLLEGGRQVHALLGIVHAVTPLRFVGGGQVPDLARVPGRPGADQGRNFQAQREGHFLHLVEPAGLDAVRLGIQIHPVIARFGHRFQHLPRLLPDIAAGGRQCA